MASGAKSRIINPCENCPIAMQYGVVKDNRFWFQDIASINDREAIDAIGSGIAVLDGTKCRKPKASLDFGIKACKGAIIYK